PSWSTSSRRSAAPATAGRIKSPKKAIRNVRNWRMSTNPPRLVGRARRSGWPRPAVFTLVRESLVLGLGTIPAHPGEGPIGNLALILRQIGAPGIRLDRGLSLRDDLELTVGLDLADHHRF